MGLSYVWFLQIWCFVAGAALFWAQGCVFYIGSSAVESARGEYFGGADGAHFYQDWSLEEKFGEQEFASDIVIDEFYILQSLDLLCFILTFWSVLWGIPFFSLKKCTRHSDDVLGCAWSCTSAFVCREFFSRNAIFVSYDSFHASNMYYLVFCD